MRGLAAAQDVLAGEHASAAAWRVGLNRGTRVSPPPPHRGQGLTGRKQSGSDGGADGSDYIYGTMTARER